MSAFTRRDFLGLLKFSPWLGLASGRAVADATPAAPISEPTRAPRKNFDAVTVHLTARDLEPRLHALPPVAFVPQIADSYKRASITLDDQVTYQEIEGFGGAFTEAAAVTLRKLPEARQEEILRAYFDPDSGHGYTLCRTHINSCDFSLDNYSYCDQPGDFDLKTFSIARDRQALLPMIQRAQKISRNGFKLFASPWSPPAWMKTNGEMNHGGSLKPECREAWANYFGRYIHAYADEGVPIWGVTIQNEPESAQHWDSCVYTGEEERDFLRDHLGPALQRAGLGQVKIIIWDHNRDRFFDFVKKIYDDPRAAQYAWGAGFHWYSADCFDNVQAVHDAWPDKKVFLSEACQEGGPHDGSWLMGERYAASMIHDLNHWSVGWVDWNMVLDQNGGPNHVGNFCSSPVIANTDTGEVHYQSSFYYLGHFSKFIRPGAKRILSAPTRDELEVTAFKNTDGSIVAVVLNESEITIPFALKINGYEAVLESPQRSIQTAVIPAI